MSDTLTKEILKEELNSVVIKLIQSFAESEKAIKADLSLQNKKIDGLYGLVDTYAKDVEIYHHDMLASSNQMDRLQRWVEQVAKQTGVKLEY